MQATMILAPLLMFFALFSPVELFKFYHKTPAEGSLAPPPPPAGPEPLDADRLYSPVYLAPPRYYPMPAELMQPQLPLEAPLQASGVKGVEFQETKSFGTKGLASSQPQPLPLAQQQPPLFAQPQQPASIAYLVVRPIPPAPFQQFDANFYRNYHHHQQQLLQVPPRPAIRQAEPAGLKGGRVEQSIEQQHEQFIEEPHQPLVGQSGPALVMPIGASKEGKLRAMLDKLMSRITLGSSYQVTGEEIVQPAPQPQFIQQQPIQQQHIEQQPIEQQQQQKLEQVEEQRLEQQVEQHRDNGFEEATKSIKQQDQTQFQLQQQQQIREEPLEQQQQLVLPTKTQQEPIKQQLEPAHQEIVTKGKRVPQLPLSQEPIRQEAKGNAAF